MSILSNLDALTGNSSLLDLWLAMDRGSAARNLIEELRAIKYDRSVKVDGDVFHRLTIPSFRYGLPSVQDASQLEVMGPIVVLIALLERLDEITDIAPDESREADAFRAGAFWATSFRARNGGTPSEPDIAVEIAARCL